MYSIWASTAISSTCLYVRIDLARSRLIKIERLAFHSFFREVLPVDIMARHWHLLAFSPWILSISALGQNDIQLFVKQNAGNEVGIHYETANLQKSALTLQRELSAIGVYSTAKALMNEDSFEKCHFNILILSSVDLGFQTSLTHMRNQSSKSFLVQFEDNLSEGEWHLIRELLSNASQNALFYILENNDWKYALTIKHESQVVINPLQFKGILYQPYF